MRKFVNRKRTVKSSGATKKVGYSHKRSPSSSFSNLSHDDLVILSSSYSRNYPSKNEVTFRKVPSEISKMLSKKGTKAYERIEKKKDSPRYLESAARSIDTQLNRSEKKIVNRVKKKQGFFR